MRGDGLDEGLPHSSGSSAGKESLPVMQRLLSVPGSGRSPREGIDYPTPVLRPGGSAGTV